MASAGGLVVRIGSQAHTLTAANGVAVIGRDPSATVRVNDDRISRSHVRLEPRHDGWQVVDTSTNGVFVDGVRRNSVLVTAPTTVHLGDADGIPVTLLPGESRAAVAPVESDDCDDNWDELAETDPDVARAGRAVAARRRELDITQRSLARDKVINAGTLIAFEKGRSWPRRGTLTKLEEVLNWPAGTITRIRNGAPAAQGVQSGEVTEVLAETVQAPLMAEAVELAMHSIGAAVNALPGPTEPDFTQRATPILADLRKLETVAANAARNARGTPSVVLALSAVRRRYNELMLRAAKSPSATLGQRLYGARHRAELSIDEAANAAGVAADAVLDAESERSVPPDVAAALDTLIAQLAMS
ncbi:FHA domain-containing protein [Candidatus Mycobacterium wuenschmannii]|uniref:FHA domain-containing protein n=1 Tax=Candidatus Mycobacterium wuenschmannii TaxID=3027808 RepID=A0ABY8VTZ2_9MYCO|nr:FHA domain-containing protein [Candidatus Mycobacterium wuenschmannii]WIM87095.1 FHA domain-containing protein [Candidatus Mycobacterium wuenschmannii]